MGSTTDYGNVNRGGGDPLSAHQGSDDVTALRAVFEDFMISRKAAGATDKTVEHYEYTVGGFVDWLEEREIREPNRVTASLVRKRLQETREKGFKDTTVHAHARGIRAFVNFMHGEGYVDQPILFDMPRLEKKRMPYLRLDELERLHASCTNLRDEALILTLLDTGLRLEEATMLRWDDIDLQEQIVRIRRGKGGKARSAVIGDNTLAALLAYRDYLTQVLGRAPQGDAQVWLSVKRGSPLTANGMSQALRRLGRTAGVHVSPHMFRRSFATLCAKSGMNLADLQQLMGHSTLAMTLRYIQVSDDDLREAHAKHGPVDHLLFGGGE